MTVEEKKELVKNNIITNLWYYKDNLVGKYFMYIFDNQCFEMYYGTENYLHLTGVGSKVSSSAFYTLAKDGLLHVEQIYFNQIHPLKTALQKTGNLHRLPDFIKNGYIILKDFVTDSETYPYVITDISLSVLLGLQTESIDEIYIPKSFRIKGNLTSKCDPKNQFKINAILSKTDKEALYDTILYKDDTDFSKLDQSISSNITNGLL